MSSVASALVAAFRTLLDPRMLALVLWPLLAAILLWAGLAFFFWHAWEAGLSALVQATPMEKWVAHGFLAAVSHALVDIVLVALLMAQIYLTALVIAAVFVMPVMVNHVARRHYPGLERRHGGSMADSVANTAIATAVYCIGWVAALPFWLLFPPAAVVPVLLMAYLSQRLFRHDALAEHASRQEYAQIVARSRIRLYALGAVASVLNLVPLVNLFSPVYSGLAFTHLCLGELEQLRRQA